jgi:hypothetical protein
MSKVTNLRNALPLSNETVKVIREADAAIVEAINKAVKAGIPQGMLVGMLHGYALEQTARMINAAD